MTTTRRARKPRGPNKRQEFNAALAYIGLTQKQWCEQTGVEASHLIRVLTGERPSAKLTATIDDVIARFRQQVIQDSRSRATEAQIADQVA